MHLSTGGAASVDYVSLSGRFLPSGYGEWTAFWVAFVVAAVLIVVMLRKVGSLADIPPSVNQLKFLEWERDRLLSVAKGTGSSAAAFLAALVLALAKDEIKANVSGLSIVGCLAGAVALLLGAMQMNLRTRVLPTT